jgi:flagellar hook protein FlgE
MDLTSIALSALQASSFGGAVRANNIANVNSDGYKAKRVNYEDQEVGGVRVASLTTSEEPTVPNGSNVELAEEFTQNIIDVGTYKAGIALLKTADDLLGYTLDLKA